jgi:hypothetical protein
MVIVNKLSWLVIQCGSLKGGRMEKLGCRYLAMIINSTIIEITEDKFLISHIF